MNSSLRLLLAYIILHNLEGIKKSTLPQCVPPTVVNFAMSSVAIKPHANAVINVRTLNTFDAVSLLLQLSCFPIFPATTTLGHWKTVHSTLLWFGISTLPVGLRQN